MLQVVYKFKMKSGSDPIFFIDSVIVHIFYFADCTSKYLKSLEFIKVLLRPNTSLLCVQYTYPTLAEAILYYSSFQFA